MRDIHFNDEGNTDIESMSFGEIDSDGEMEIIVELYGAKNGSVYFYIDTESIEGLYKHIENERNILQTKTK
jgi:hypothetical protein